MTRSSLPLVLIVLACVVASAAVLITVASRVNNDPTGNLPQPPRGNNHPSNTPGNTNRPDDSASPVRPSLIKPVLPNYPQEMVEKIRRWTLELKNYETADPAERALLELDARACIEVDRAFQFAFIESRNNPNDPDRHAYAERLDRVLTALQNQPYVVGSQQIWPGVAVDAEHRIVVADATALPRAKTIEYPICGPRGKAHEALFKLAPTAVALAKALEAIQLVPCSADKRPRFIRDWQLYDGDTVRISVRLDEGGNIAERPLESFLLMRGDKMPPTGWALLGLSVGPTNRSVADETGAIVGALGDPSSLLTNPWPTAQFDNAHTSAGSLPPDRAPVQLVFVPEPKAEREERRARLLPEWQRYEPVRAKLLAEPHATPGTGPSANSNSNSSGNHNANGNAPEAGDPDDNRPPNERQPLLGHAPAAEGKVFLPLCPPPTPGQLAQLEAWVEQLSHKEQAPAATAELMKLDARFEAALLELWRANRGREPQESVLTEAVGAAPIRPYEKDGIRYYRELAVDVANRRIFADAEISSFQNTPLEFLVCGPRGKGHESVLLLKPYAKVLQAALEQIGLKPSNLAPDYQGDWKLYDGDSVVIEVAWFASRNAETPPALATEQSLRGTPGISVARIEQFVLDSRTQQSLPPTGFVFIGSPETQNGVCLADERGGIIGAFSFETSVLENPWPGAADAHRYRANLAMIPPPKTPLRLVLSPEPAEARHARLKALQPEWETRRLTLPRVEFEMPRGWSKPSRHDWVWKSPQEASFAVMVEPNYTKETTITEDLKKFVLSKTEAPDFKRVVAQWDGTHQGLPAWFFYWEDTDGGFIFRGVVMAKHYFYHTFYYVPGAKDEAALRKEFDALMAMCDLDHPELRPQSQPQSQKQK